MALKKAKERIGIRREELVNQNAFNYGIYNRYQGMYDPLSYSFEDREKDKDAERQKSIAKVSNTPIQVIISDWKSSD